MLLMRMVLKPAFILIRVLMFAVLTTILGVRNVPSISKSTWGLLPTPKLRPMRFVKASTKKTQLSIFILPLESISSLAFVCCGMLG